MNDESFSSKLRKLSNDYYQKRISFVEYRATRSVLLNQIDEEFNGRKVDQAEPVDKSIFMKTIAFFANTDLTNKTK